MEMITLQAQWWMNALYHSRTWAPHYTATSKRDLYALIIGEVKL
jgi:hypothetical protein